MNLKVGTEREADEAIKAMDLIKDDDFLEIIEKHMWAEVSNPNLRYADGKVITYVAQRLQRMIVVLRGQQV